jgi:hypothetical protein
MVKIRGEVLMICGEVVVFCVVAVRGLRIRHFF